MHRTVMVEFHKRWTANREANAAAAAGAEASAAATTPAAAAPPIDGNTASTGDAASTTESTASGTEHETAKSIIMKGVLADHGKFRRR